MENAREKPPSRNEDAEQREGVVLEVPKSPEEVRAERAKEIDARLLDLDGQSKSPEDIQSMATSLEQGYVQQVGDLEAKLGISVSAESKLMIHRNIVDAHVDRANDVRKQIGTLRAEKEALLPSSKETPGADARPEAPPRVDDDPRYKALVEERSLSYLKTNDTEWFSKGYSGELGPNGRLLDTKGNETDTLPSQAITGGLTQVHTEALASFAAQHPAEASSYMQAERVFAYPDIGNDPTVQQVLRDASIRASAETYGSSPESRLLNERMHALNDFSRKYPEKAAAYAEQWRASGGNGPQELRLIANAYERAQKKPATAAEKRAAALEAISMPLEKMEAGFERGPVDPNKAVADVMAEHAQDAKKKGLHGTSMRKEDLKKRNYLSGSTMGDLVDMSGKDLGPQVVDSGDIIGSVSLAFSDWSTEYDSRDGRIEDVARELLDSPETAASHVFHPDEPQERIKLKRIDGPAGPLYVVKDGTHRVAGAKLAEMRHIVADVEEEAAPSTLSTTEIGRGIFWRKMIEGGLMRGTVTEEPDGQFHLQSQENIVPWAVLDQSQFLKVGVAYEKTKPGSLDAMKNLKTGKPVPPDVFKNEIALNFYLAGRWDEYKPKAR